MRQSIGFIASILGLMGGIILMIMSMDKRGNDETGMLLSGITIALSVIFGFVSLYSAKSREMREKEIKLLEQIHNALKPNYPTDGEAKHTSEGSEDATDFSTSMKQDINKYKEMYESGQITKEVYTELLENQSSKLG